MYSYDASDGVGFMESASSSTTASASVMIKCLWSEIMTNCIINREELVEWLDGRESH